MKLYTEEQVRQTFRNGFLYAMSNQLNEDAIVDSLTPIELPSDEEIGKEMDKLPFIKHVDDGLYNDGQLIGFELGANWIKEQILNKNKS